MELINNGGNEFKSDDPVKCINCGRFNYYIDNICGRCADLIPRHIPQTQYKSYFLLNKNK